MRLHREFLATHLGNKPASEIDHACEKQICCQIDHTGTTNPDGQHLIDGVNLEYPRFRIDMQAIDDTRTCHHANLGNTAFKCRSGCTSTGHQPAIIAQNNLCIGPYIDQY